MVGMTTKVAEGILTWDGVERRSGRYGSICLDCQNYDNTCTSVAFLEYATLTSFMGKRVRMTCRVLESRESGHVGDMFLDIKPSRPEVGEEVDLGVADFSLGESSWGPKILIMAPKDGRKDNWIDPRKLYRLHDQTVEVFLEETQDPYTPDPGLKPKRGDGTVMGSDEKGIFGQSRGVSDEEALRMTQQATVRNMGDGLFVVGAPEDGTFIPAEKDLLAYVDGPDLAEFFAEALNRQKA